MKPLQQELDYLRAIGEDDIADRISLRLQAMGNKEDWLVECNNFYISRAYDLRKYLEGYLHLMPENVQKRAMIELGIRG